MACHIFLGIFRPYNDIGKQAFALFVNQRNGPLILVAGSLDYVFLCKIKYFLMSFLRAGATQAQKTY